SRNSERESEEVVNDLRKPEISILMPAKNSVLFLKKTLDSVVSQTETEWELVAVNDGSTDDTAHIFSEYADRDERIKIFENEEGMGIIPALKTALKHSSGNLITRMDSDDLMALDKLETMRKLLERKGKGHVATGLVECFSDEGINDGYRKYEKWINELILSDNLYSEIYKECVIQSSCWMVHREDLIKCGAFESDIYPEDYDLCFRFYKHGMKPVAEAGAGVLHYWRDHTARVSRNNPEYADQQFFDLKLKYYFEIERKKNRGLVVWGTGAKGKKLARKLLDKYENSFRWITDNPKKIGEKIYGVQVESTDIVKEMKNIQIIVAVSAIDENSKIEEVLKRSGLVKNEDYYCFC
ncbi:MAG: glycosyltransferase family 2 protein, partial [Candidatus Delongbacteria bacterium]|nr:glycosyltransferase family 2 protein [Candidatus Delongbacteria bacterium]